MKIYISGAITNNENYKKDFEKAESEVRGLGGAYHITPQE